ncbi:acyl-CoA N-acyltransferase [Poronia punctata]|nr:acyl-CoA N-acyltransferase [Poronia punctata]
MPLILQPATAADAPRSAEIEKLAYAPNPFNKYLFPGPFPEPEPGRNPRAEDLAKVLTQDPSVRWTKVVDTDVEPSADNAQMIAFGQWHVKDGGEAPEPKRTFGPGTNPEACEELFGGIAELRAKHFGGRKHVHIRLLHVDPKHKRRGAGRMMVNYVVEQAQALGLPTFLESSMEGHGLYLSCGFRDMEERVIDFSRWGMEGDTNHINYIMGRDF